MHFYFYFLYFEKSGIKSGLIANNMQQSIIYLCFHRHEFSTIQEKLCIVRVKYISSNCHYKYTSKHNFYLIHIDQGFFFYNLDNYYKVICLKLNICNYQI